MARKKEGLGIDRNGTRAGFVSYDSITEAVIAEASANEWSLPSTENLQKMDQRIKWMKSLDADFFDNIEVLYMFDLAPGDEDFSYINWEGRFDFNCLEAGGTPPVIHGTAGRGMDFSGTSNGYLNTQWRPNADKKIITNQDVGIYWKQTGGNPSGSAWGCRTNSSNNFFTSGSTTFVNGGTQGGVGSPEIWGVNRLDAKVNDGSQYWYFDGVLNNSAVYPSGSLTNIPMAIGARNLNGAISQYHTRQVKYVMIGLGSFLATHQAALSNIFSDTAPE